MSEEELDSFIDHIKLNSKDLLDRNISERALKSNVINKGIMLYLGNINDQTIIDFCALIISYCFGPVAHMI